MRRTIVILTMAAVIAAVIALSAGPALAVVAGDFCMGWRQSTAHAQQQPPFVDIV
jgi:hypothetical protein